MNNKRFLSLRTLFMVACLTLPTGVVNAGAIYKFGSRCPLDTSPLPISFQQPDDDVVSYRYNIIWVEGDGIDGLDKFYDLYQTPYNQSAWPRGFASGRGGVTCASASSECPHTSKYSSIVGTYGSDTLAWSDAPNGAAALSWTYVPVRKLKFLRIEVFIQSVALRPSEAGDQTEPIYFQYEATGNGNELRLTESGSTSDDKSSIVLPTTFNPLLVSDIQVWFERVPSLSYAYLRNTKPKAHIDSFSQTQMSLVPESCK